MSTINSNALAFADDDNFDDLLKPQALAQYANIPAEMRAAKNWLVYRLEDGKDGKKDKIPYNPRNGRKANNPSLGVSFEEACAHVASYHGLGFYVESPYLVIDIDACVDKNTGVVADYAADIIREMGSFSELSPSGTGVHVWAKGEKPGAACRRGIEIYSTKHFMTVTGVQIPGTPSVLKTVDIGPIYQRMLAGEFKQEPTGIDSISQKSDAPRTNHNKLIHHRGALTDELTLLTTGGFVENSTPFTVADEGQCNTITFDSQSEAVASLLFHLAIKHGGDAEKMEAGFFESTLYKGITKWNAQGGKWERRGREELGSAIRKYEATKGASSSTTTVDSHVTSDLGQYREMLAAAYPQITVGAANEIPVFDPSVIGGIYGDFVELITRGTTLVPQFAFVIAKTVVGMRMAGKVKFETLTAEPRYYAALIGETGSGKGEAWRRMRSILTPGSAKDACKIKIVNSADSAAGLKDLFFHAPEDWPVLCYVDEVKSLGNKTRDTKAPEIVDTIIELANETQISRVLADRGKQKRSKTKDDARLGVVICGQSGEAYMSSFPKRTDMGLWDRFYPEFSVPIAAGDMPPIPMQDGLDLLSGLNSMVYTGSVGMEGHTKKLLEDFWQSQPLSVRTKVRFRTNLFLDAYMSAFGRRSWTVERADADAAIKIFQRQMVIRRKHFGIEIPDPVGRYTARIKALTEQMAVAILNGVEPETVALSRRDFENQSNSYRDNEGSIFERAWNPFLKVYLMPIDVLGKNGHKYTKYIPRVEE